MPTNKPRIKVSFNESDAEMMQMICKRKNISKSKLIRQVMEEWLEEYEDMILAQRAEEAEERWKKTISHEELWIKTVKDRNQDTQDEIKPISY